MKKESKIVLALALLVCFVILYIPSVEDSDMQVFPQASGLLGIKEHYNKGETLTSVGFDFPCSSEEGVGVRYTVVAPNGKEFGPFERRNKWSKIGPPTYSEPKWFLDLWEGPNPTGYVVSCGTISLIYEGEWSIVFNLYQDGDWDDRCRGLNQVRTFWVGAPNTFYKCENWETIYQEFYSAEPPDGWYESPQMFPTECIEPTYNLKIKTLPTNCIVVLEDEDLQLSGSNGAEYVLIEGAYTAIISSDGYIIKEETIELTENKIISVILQTEPIEEPEQFEEEPEQIEEEPVIPEEKPIGGEVPEEELEKTKSETAIGFEIFALIGIALTIILIFIRRK